jgi:hypothetical protein
VLFPERRNVLVKCYAANPQLCLIPHTHPLRAFCDLVFHSFAYSHSLLPSNPTGPSFLCNHPRFFAVTRYFYLPQVAVLFLK